MNLYSEDILHKMVQPLLHKLIATPSFSKEEHDTAIILQQFMESHHVIANRQMNNIWAKNLHYDDNKPTILLNSHHDTVKPNSGYTKDPFCPMELDGKLFGLGSNDAGGCLVALLATFLYYYEKPDLKYNLVFAATAEEEISGVGGIAALLPLLGQIDLAIVGEPTMMHMAIAEKGLIVLDCETTGIAGHAARDEGENAIYKSLQDIQWFSTYQFPKVSALLGPVKMSLTIIHAGTQHNVIPETCHYTVDIRVNECYTNEEIVAIVNDKVACKITPRSLRLRSTSIDIDNPLVKAGMTIGREYYGSSTLSDKVFMTFPALKIGPGDSARSHMADEYIYVNEIREGIELYIQMLNQLV